MLVVLVTGSRAYKSQGRLWARLDELAGYHLAAYATRSEPFVLMHGAAPSGADEYAHQWAIHRGNLEWRGEGLRFYEQADPAAWTGHMARRAGHVRNARQANRLQEYHDEGVATHIIVCHYAPTIYDLMKMEKGGTRSQVDKLAQRGFELAGMDYLGDA